MTKTLSYMKMLAFVLFLCISLLPSAARAQRIQVEAENFINFHDLGGTPILADGALLRGLDFEGEWTEYQVSDIYDLGTRSILIIVWGTQYVQYHLQVTVTPENMVTSETVDVIFFGKGNCGT